MIAAEHPRELRGVLGCLSLIGGLVCMAPAYSAVEFEPTVSVGVAYTDNLTLVSANPERETVYQLIPAFSLQQNGVRMTTDMDYSVEAYRYENRNDHDTYQNVSADSRLALDPDNFFLELGAFRDQTIREPEASIARSNVPITTNRVNRDDYYVGPTFEYPLGSNSTIRGNYRRTRTQYDQDESTSFFVADFDADTYGVSVDNYRKERGVTWAVEYTADKTDYGGAFLPWEYRQAAVELGAWAGRGSRLFVTGGRESAWDTPSDPSLADDYWEVGFAKQAGANLSLEVAAGKRATFGSSKRATLDYTFRSGRMQLNYREQPTTEGHDRSSGVTLPDLLEGGFDDLLARPGSAERFLLNHLGWSLSLDFRRATVSLAMFDESRKERTGLDGTPLEDEAQSGISFGVGWRLGARTELNVRADRSRREFGPQNKQSLRYVSVGANYDVGARTSLALYLTRAEESSNGGALGVDYEADLTSLLLTRTF
jgi:hypothetical protein